MSMNLKNILENSELMKKLIDETEKNSKNCVFENHYNKFEKFLEELKRDKNERK